MDYHNKISPFQLVCILILARLFGVLTISLQDGEFGSVLVAYLFTTVAQIAIILLAQKLSYSKVGNSPMLLDCGRGCHKAMTFIYMVVIGVITAISLYRFGDFFSVSFYQGEYKKGVTFLLMVIVSFAVFQGLEAIARACPIIMIVVVVGLICLFAASIPEMKLRYLPQLTFSIKGTLTTTTILTGMNAELILLLLLQPYTTTGKIKNTAVYVWVAGITALTALTAMVVSLSLGVYASEGEYPLFVVAQAAGIPVLQRLDSILMGMWIFLGVIKVGIYLFIFAQLWGELLHKKVKPVGIIAMAFIVWIVSIGFGLVAKETMEMITIWFMCSSLVVGTILLPTLGKFLTKKSGVKHETS